MKNIALFVSLLIPSVAAASVRPIQNSGSVAASTATVIRDYNGNATVPYGIVAATAAFGSGATKSTFTTTGALTLSGGIRVGGTLYSHAASSTTGATNATALIVADSMVVPANTLSNAGDSINVYCVAKATSTNLSKQMAVTVNGTTTDWGATSATDTNWENKTKIWRISNSLLGVKSVRMRDALFVSAQSWSVSYDSTVSFSISCDIKASATAYGANAGDENMELKYMMVVYYPAP